MIREWVIAGVKSVVSNAQLPDLVLQASPPPDTAMGDLALPLGFALAKAMRMSPPQSLAALLPDLQSFFGSELVFSIQGGFLNIRFSDVFLWQEGMAFSGKNVSKPRPSVLLEYVSANPTGPLHIGHGRWAVMGSIIVQLLRETGHQVHSEFYINDAGKQIDKLYESVSALRSGQPVPEDGYHGAYVQSLADTDKDPVVANLESQKHDLAAIGVVFDAWYSEKKLHMGAAIEAAMATLSEKKVTYEADGALWFRSTDFGDDKDRVLRKADGGLTYFAVDVAYHLEKVSRGFDQLVNMWGADHHGYISRIRASLHAVFGESRSVEPAFRVLLGQLVSLFRDGEPVRMSKRTGDMVTLSEVIEEVGSDAVRYYLAAKGFDSHVDFDLARAKEKSAENPVYYVQYAHARLCGVLRKAALLGDALADRVVIPFSAENALHPKERQVILHMAQYGDAVTESALLFSPHKFVQYTFDLARASHHMYESCPILGHPMEAQRLVLVTKTRDVLAQCLGLLGISAPSVM
jgi:arginyl-tRNA synthetase